jgi:hypothetical protein
LRVEKAEVAGRGGFRGGATPSAQAPARLPAAAAEWDEASDGPPGTVVIKYVICD